MPDITVPYTTDSGEELSIRLSIPKEKIKIRTDATGTKRVEDLDQDYLNNAAKIAATSQYPEKFGLPGPVKPPTLKVGGEEVNPGKSYKVTRRNVGEKSDNPLQPYEEKLFDAPGVRYLAHPIEDAINAPISGKSWQGKTADLIEGGLAALSPVATAGAMKAPMMAARALAPTIISGGVAQGISSILGQKPDTQRLVRDISGFVPGAASAISPKLASIVPGGLAGGVKEFFDDGHFRGIPLVKGLSSMLAGAWTGRAMHGTEGAITGGILGGAAPFIKGAVQGAAENMKGKDWIDKSITGFLKKSPGQPSPAIASAASPVNAQVAATQPPVQTPYSPNFSRTQNPFQGLPSPNTQASPAINTQTGWTRPQQPNPVTINMQRSIEGGAYQPQLPAPPTLIITPAPVPPKALPAPGNEPIIRTQGAIPVGPASERVVNKPIAAKAQETQERQVEKPKPEINESNWQKNIVNPIKKIISKTEEIEQKPTDPTVVAKAPDKTVENHKLLGFLNRRKGASIEDIQNQYGLSAEQAKKQLNSLKEEDQAYNKSGKWYEGKEEITEPKPKRIVKKPESTEKPKKEEPAKQLTMLELLNKEKPSGPSLEDLEAKLKSGKVLSNEEYKKLGELRDKQDEEIESKKTQETSNSITTPEVDESKRSYLSKEEQYKFADSLGITPTQSSRWLQEQGMELEPLGPYGISKYKGKKQINYELDRDEANKLLEKMGKKTKS